MRDAFALLFQVYRRGMWVKWMDERTKSLLLIVSDICLPLGWWWLALKCVRVVCSLFPPRGHDGLLFSHSRSKSVVCTFVKLSLVSPTDKHFLFVKEMSVDGVFDRLSSGVAVTHTSTSHWKSSRRKTDRERKRSDTTKMSEGTEYTGWEHENGQQWMNEMNERKSAHSPSTIDCTLHIVVTSSLLNSYKLVMWWSFFLFLYLACFCFPLPFPSVSQSLSIFVVLLTSLEREARKKRDFSKYRTIQDKWTDRFISSSLCLSLLRYLPFPLATRGYPFKFGKTSSRLHIMD